MADGSDQDRRDRDAGNTSSGGGVDIDVDQGARTSMGDITGRDRIEAAGDVHIHNYPGAPPRPRAPARRASVADSGECPYPGMVPFEDPRFFYGRQSDTERVVQHIRDHKLTLLVGPSGSGKSSLMRAGVEPALPGWPVCRVRPGSEPATALRQALGMGEGERVAALAAALDALLAERADARVLVLVDPLEELFVAAADEQERFCELVARLVDEPRCAPVLALRADFYAELMASALWDLVEPRIVPVQPLRGEALRAAIREPAQAQGVEIEDELVERLVADATGEPGVLPLLQETLRWLWERRERRDQELVLPGSLYEAERERAERSEGVGPLGATLARKADAALADLERADRAVARRVMVRLVQFRGDRPPTRQQQPLEALAGRGDMEAVQRVVGHLAERRMLVLSGEQGEGERRVDLAHEALIHAWPTFREWIEEWREDELKRRRFEARAAEWVAHDRRGGLLDEVALAEVEEWLAGEAAAQVGASDDLRGLVAASRQVLRRARRWRRIAVGMLVVLLGAATVFGVLATRARAEAERQRDRARNAIVVSRDLAQEIVWTADRKLEHVVGAAEARRELLDVAGKLLERLRQEDASDLEAKRDAAVRHDQRGDLALSHDDLGRARQHYQKALELAQELVAAEPDNALWQHDLSVSHDKLGDVERAAGKLEAARDHYEQGLEIAKKLAEGDPGNAQWLRDLIASEMRLAVINAEQGKLADARRHLDAARAVLARIDAAGMLRGDALLEQYRQAIAEFERILPP